MSDTQNAIQQKSRLKWSEPTPPNSKCSYDHTEAETVFGRFLLTWKSWKDQPDFGFDETPWGQVVYENWNSLEEARAWAEQEFTKKLLQALNS